MPIVYNNRFYLGNLVLHNHYPFFKRLTDMILSLVFLIVLSPVFLLLAVAIRLESRGPVIFRQWRYGYQGRQFLIYKFRTLQQHQSCQTGGDQVGDKEDKRLTRLGHFLRRKSLDELPQLINVLKGDMSLVGPRPHAVDHHDYYTGLIPHYANRLHVPPGLTGLAQITGCRGATPQLQHMYARFELDQLYMARRSYRLDMKILYLTMRRRAWRVDHF